MIKTNLTACLVVLDDLHLWSCGYALLFGKKTGAKAWQWHPEKSKQRQVGKNAARIFPPATRPTDGCDLSEQKPVFLLKTGSMS